MSSREPAVATKPGVAAPPSDHVPVSRAYFESINGDLYLWRIGQSTAEQALDGIEEWVRSVEQAERMVKEILDRG